jgi:hypothetical protein
VILDLLFNACLGLAFALCARDRLRADGPFAYPAFPLVAAFAGIVVAPLTLYFYTVHAAWSWMYLVDPAGLPGLLIIPLLILHGGVVLAGFYLGARLVKAGRERQLIYAVVAVAVVVVGGAALAWGRLGRYGTYLEFHDGRALALMEVKLGYVMVGVVLGIAAAAGFTALDLLRDARRVRSR